MSKETLLQFFKETYSEKYTHHIQSLSLIMMFSWKEFVTRNGNTFNRYCLKDLLTDSGIHSPLLAHIADTHNNMSAHQVNEKEILVAVNPNKALFSKNILEFLATENWEMREYPEEYDVKGNITHILHDVTGFNFLLVNINDLPVVEEFQKELHKKVASLSSQSRCVVCGNVRKLKKERKTTMNWEELPQLFTRNPSQNDSDSIVNKRPCVEQEIDAKMSVTLSRQARALRQFFTKTVKPSGITERHFIKFLKNSKSSYVRLLGQVYERLHVTHEINSTIERGFVSVKHCDDTQYYAISSWRNMLENIGAKVLLDIDSLETVPVLSSEVMKCDTELLSYVREEYKSWRYPDYCRVCANTYEEEQS